VSAPYASAGYMAENRERATLAGRVAPDGPTCRYLVAVSSPGPDVLLNVLTQYVERHVSTQDHRVIERLEIEAGA
jgi:hypothetical protein